MSSFSLTQTFGPKLAENQKLRIHLSGSASFDTITRSGLNLIKKQSKLRKKSNYTIVNFMTLRSYHRKRRKLTYMTDNSN